MANKIYVDQALTVIYTDEDGFDFGTISIRVDYWAPSNKTSTPTGTIDGGDISKDGSEVTIVFDKDILSEPNSDAGVKWRYQIFDTATEIGWTPGCISVLKKGVQICS